MFSKYIAVNFRKEEVLPSLGWSIKALWEKPDSTGLLKDKKQLHTRVLILLTKKLHSNSLFMWPSIVPPNKEEILEAQRLIPGSREN